jgi:hypothetical protein
MGKSTLSVENPILSEKKCPSLTKYDPGIVVNLTIEYY